MADARIDARPELRAALARAGHQVRDRASDAELILHAYRAWGTECVEHLIGDFAFAVWDAARRTLFAARDPLGVKPFFYSHRGSWLAFANTLDCVRGHPDVDSALDELFIADFLLFEMSQEPSATAFAAVRRLAPAHWLELSPSGLRTRRYWTLPHARIVRYPREADHLERFAELLDRAVADRLDDSRVSVFMSGGLDSPAVAVSAVRRGAHAHAFTTVYDSIIRDEERHYSSIAAGAIGIPLSHRAVDGYELFERYEDLAHCFPEPANAPFAAIDSDLAADAARHARVALTGWDGDSLLVESPRPYLQSLSAHGQWLAWARTLARYVAAHPWATAKSAWLRLHAAPREPAAAPEFPAWIETGFATRLRLRERWEAQRHGVPVTAADPVRPAANAAFAYLARASSFFEHCDAARTGAALEMRHPFLDLRLVQYCLSLPPVPWCVRKEILRRSLRGALPDTVRLRPKSPLGGFPHLEVLRRPQSRWVERFEPCPDAARFVVQGKIPSMAATGDAASAWSNLRPVSLDLWLRHARPA